MNRKADLYLYYGLLAVIAAFFALMTFWSPLAFDDYVFMNVYNEVNGGSDSFSLRALYDFAMEIRKADNCRLANIMDPVFTLMSPCKEIFPWLNGLLCAAIIWMIIKIARIERYRSAAAAVIWAAVVVCLPWRNSMFVTDYALNYVFPAFLTLLLIFQVCRATTEGWTAGRTALIVLLALPTGAWHEGFFAATIAGFGFYALLRKFHMPWQWWVAMAVYAAIALVFALSPGILTRAVREIVVEPRELPLWEIMFDLAPCTFMVAAYPAIAITAKGRRFLSHLFRSQAFVVFTIAAVAGVVLSVIVTHRPRTVFWPNLCCIVSMTIAAAEYVKYAAVAGRSKLAKAFFAMALASVLFCLGHGALSLKWQNIFYLENRAIMGQVEAGVNDVYHDRMHRFSPRAASLCFPVSNIWIPFHYRGLCERMGRHIAVVPTALREVRTLPADTLDGDLGAMRTGDAIWVDNTVLPERYELPLDITLADGSRMIVPYCVPRHFATADGDSLTAIDMGRIDPLAVTAINLP